VGSSNWNRLFGVSLFGILAVAGCSDKAQSPVVEGFPPAFLAGVWEVVDSSFEGYQAWVKQGEDEFTDTICVGGPDFGTINALTTWEMYLRYNELIEGIYTPLEVKYCSGVIRDDSINVFCEARASATLEACDFKVRFYTRGTPHGDTWTLLRTVERIEGGRECGMQKGDSIVYSTTYQSTLTRIGDAREDCAEGASSTIGR
jgi:hypothetical protein